MPRVHIQTLGCAKNEVDSDKLTARLAIAGCDTTATSSDADVVIVNTCAFIDAARRESVGALVAACEDAAPGARVVAVGCLAERHGAELAAALPQLEVVGFDGYPQLLRDLGDRSGPATSLQFFDLPDRPAPDTPWAYVKIAEGCDRTCSFCAIPQFRGKQRSRTPASIELEIQLLKGQGVSEIVLVAQDPAWYGRDKGEPGAIVPLLRRVARIDGVEQIRLLYLYPRDVTADLIEVIASEPAIAPYFDLSLQHAGATTLRAMRRYGSVDASLALLDHIRSAAPGAVCRSSFIVGHPGEDESEFIRLLEFVDVADLDWMGFFTFSPEQGTHAFGLPHVSASEARARLDEVETTARVVMARQAETFVGRELRVLVDEPGRARSYREAPEIDGVVHIDGGAPGEWRTVTVTGTDATDLIASTP